MFDKLWVFYLFNCPKRFFSICGVEHYILNDGDEGITKKGGFLKERPLTILNFSKFLFNTLFKFNAPLHCQLPWFLLSPVLLRGKQISGLLISELRLFCSPILCRLLDGSAHMGLAYNRWWWQYVWSNVWKAQALSCAAGPASTVSAFFSSPFFFPSFSAFCFSLCTGGYMLVSLIYICSIWNGHYKCATE